MLLFQMQTEAWIARVAKTISGDKTTVSPRVAQKTRSTKTSLYTRTQNTKHKTHEKKKRLQKKEKHNFRWKEHKAE